MNSTNANILEPREYCRHAYDLTNYWSIFVRFEFSDKNTLYNDGWVRPQPRFIEKDKFNLRHTVEGQLDWVDLCGFALMNIERKATKYE